MTTPTLPTIIPGMRWVQAEPAPSPRMSSNPAPMTIRPGPMSSLTGTCEVSLPATVEVTRIPPEITISRTPVASGE